MRNLKYIYLLTLFSVLSAFSAKGNTKGECAELDSQQTFNVYVQKMSSSQGLPLNELVVKTAQYFLGKPYLASTLEMKNEESLVVNFEEFDCTTFVETCIALALTIKSNDHTYDNYCMYLQNIRYRDGVVDGYVSRLHYMRDWTSDNEKSGLLKDISSELGGRKTAKAVNFMSVHPQYYAQLKNNTTNVEKIKLVEGVINERDDYTIVPKAKISEIGRSINIGDIIIFATAINGLDYSHIGIAYRQNGILKFIHASSRAKKVIEETQSLDRYSQLSKQCSGISVLRLNEYTSE